MSNQNLQKNSLNFGNVFLAASILSVIVTALWLIYPNPNRYYHIIITGLGKGRIMPYKAKFKPYSGKRMGGAAGVSAVIKESINEFKGQPYNIFSIGGEISGTADAYFTGGAAIIKAMNAIGVDAMLLGNIEFTFGQQRLAELAKEAEFGFIASNIIQTDTKRSPDYISSELFFNPGNGLKIGLLGISPPATPNLTTRANVEDLEFLYPDKTLKVRVDSMREAGADIVILLTLFRSDRIKQEEWQPIASAAPDICIMIDYDIEEPMAVRRDGVIVKTINGYNQSKEIDILTLELSQKSASIVSWKSERLAINHAEITPDPEVAAVIKRVTRENQEFRNSIIGKFKHSYSSQWDRECPIANMICDSMRSETNCDIAIHNSGGIRNNIQAGDFSINDLFSLMPFDNQIITMDITGKDLREAFKVSASLQRGILQISGANYSFKNQRDNFPILVSVNISGEPIDDKRIYKVCTNSFLASGGDNYISFRNGKNIRNGPQQRDIVKQYIINKSKISSMSLFLDGRITRLD